ncbi:MAG: MFS transporter [Planctomycetota bacterium]|jgi:MFS family permease|nr:MFS transporter [Planctomycetota bacterium]
MTDKSPVPRKWYSGITGYQWLVLAIASAGWIFDVFEGQLFAMLKTPAMANLLGVADNHPSVDLWSNIAFAAFLIGGAVGGLAFGVLADRFGRRLSMMLSILTYSVFTGMHYFAGSVEHIVALRFFVAMGVGGEWAVAASLVAEVFPKRARAVAGGIFHASSVLGAVLAAGVAYVLAGSTDWRVAFLFGLLPALMILWVRASIKESDKWERQSEVSTKRRGSLSELLSDPRWRYRALIGLGMAGIGLGTYWGIYAWGPELVHEILADTVSIEQRRKSAAFVYGLMNFTGGLAGLLAFAPISMVTSRRTAFAFYHVGALVMVPITFLGATSYAMALWLLPVMAFFVVGMHAGYAIYFPELFPTRLRATGASFCFNVGRLLSAAMLLARGELRSLVGLRYAVSLMALLFAVGLLLVWIAPETKDEELPE